MHACKRRPVIPNTDKVVDLVESKKSNRGVDVQEHRQQGEDGAKEWKGLCKGEVRGDDVRHSVMF